MSLRLLHYSDIENAYDDPDRIGRLAGLIDARRDERTLVCGTGDNTAPGVLALETKGRHALDFFDAVRPDAETFGNHDFDFGPDVTRELVADSPQPWLSANVYESDGETRFANVASGVVVERDGYGVGLLGLTDPNTPTACPAAGDLVFGDPIEAARETAASLRERGADYVVVLSHLGRGDDELARSVDVDAILGGHVHSERCDRIDGTLLTRPGANGAVCWEVELGHPDRRDQIGRTSQVDQAFEVDQLGERGDRGGNRDGCGAGDESGNVTTTRHDVTRAPIDESVADRLRARMDATDLSDVVATATDPLVRTRERRYGGECRVANLVADAYRWATEADVAFANTGGIRDGSPLSGDVTVADLIGLSPFAGILYTAEVTGEALRALAGRAATAPPRHEDDGKRWFGHFAGLEIVWDRETMTLVELTHEGSSVAPEATYVLATNGFVVDSDYFPVPTPADVVADYGVQYDAIVAYVRAIGVDVELDGRLRDVC